MKLQGKKVLISGGTGHLGEHLVLAFAQAGADITFTYNKSIMKSEELLEKLKVYPGKYASVKMEILENDSVIDAVGKAASGMNGIDILVNNIGIAQVMPLPLLEQEDWDLTFDTNVRGTFFVTKEVLRNMISRGQGGVIINMGSVAGYRMLEVPVHYAASKAAIHGLTYALAREVSRYNIRVNCIVPGLLEGGIGANVPKKQFDDYMAHCAAGRAGKPEEVAALAVFLASPEASYINAQLMVCDGGL